jgi:hypothetical protein
MCGVSTLTLAVGSLEFARRGGHPNSTPLDVVAESRLATFTPLSSFHHSIQVRHMSMSHNPAAHRWSPIKTSTPPEIMAIEGAATCPEAGGMSSRPMAAQARIRNAPRHCQV